METQPKINEVLAVPRLAPSLIQVPQDELDGALTRTRSARDDARARIDDALRVRDRPLSDIHYSYMWQIQELDHALVEMGAQTTPPAHQFVTSQLFLESCLLKLTLDQDEYIFYVSGPQGGGSMYLSDIVDFDIKTRSLAGVQGDDGSVFRAMMRLRRVGLPLRAWFHSHPGSGPGATAPSSVDRSQQRRYEADGYRVVGGIFTRDGHVRFFSDKLRFEIEIQGKGVSCVDSTNHVFKIDNPGNSQGDA